jgi:PPOX class probable F420-dependent enzyme
MTSLTQAWALSRDDHGLAIVTTLRADLTIQSSVVNAGVLDHPSTGEPALAFVTYGKVKLANLRARPQITATFRNGWQWAAVEGHATIGGPDDLQPWFSPALLRDIFTTAGGTHDNWADFDRTMVEQRRAAVLISPSRVYGN